MRMIIEFYGEEESKKQNPEPYTEWETEAGKSGIIQLFRSAMDCIRDNGQILIAIKNSRTNGE